MLLYNIKSMWEEICKEAFTQQHGGAPRETETETETEMEIEIEMETTATTETKATKETY